MPRKRRILRTLIAIFVAIVFLGGIATWMAYPRILTYTLSSDELFRRSRPALDAYAIQVMAPGSTALTNPPKRLGYFNVISTAPLPHGFVFQHDSCNPFDWCGIAYSTEPLPEEDKDAKGKVIQLFRPLGAKWYDVFRP
jgi:hypothetical protein